MRTSHKIATGVLGSRASSREPLIFYVKAAGSDANDGLTPATAWQTTAFVSSYSFVPGDTIRFNGGDTFAGDMVLSVGGTAARPITINSYGTGKAIFTGLVYGYDAAGYVFDNIDCQGAMFFGTSTPASTYNYLLVENCNIVGGCSLGGDTGTSGFSNVTFTNNTFTGGGISPYTAVADGSTTRPHSNFTITNNTISGGTTGIQIGGVFNATVTGNTISGTADIAGAWCYQSDNVRFANNIVHDIVPASGDVQDGDGIDIDEDCTNCIIEDNLIYDCSGAGIIVSAFPTPGAGNNGSCINPIVRNNIIVNCCIGVGNLQGNLQLVTGGGSSQITGGQVYNNTVYAKKRYAFNVTSIPIAATIANNIFYTTATALGFIDTFGAINPSNANFFGNDYFGAVTSIHWNGTTYASVAAWRAAFPAQETIAAANTSFISDPLLVNPGTHVATDYKLQAGSPMKGVGLNLLTQFGIANPTEDYFGASLPNAVGTGFNVGADGSVATASPTFHIYGF